MLRLSQTQFPFVLEGELGFVIVAGLEAFPTAAEASTRRWSRRAPTWSTWRSAARATKSSTSSVEVFVRKDYHVFGGVDAVMRFHFEEQVRSGKGAIELLFGVNIVSRIVGVGHAVFLVWSLGIDLLQVVFVEEELRSEFGGRFKLFREGSNLEVDVRRSARVPTWNNGVEFNHATAIGNLVAAKPSLLSRVFVVHRMIFIGVNAFGIAMPQIDLCVCEGNLLVVYKFVDEDFQIKRGAFDYGWSGGSCKEISPVEFLINKEWALG